MNSTKCHDIKGIFFQEWKRIQYYKILWLQVSHVLHFNAGTTLTKMKNKLKQSIIFSVINNTEWTLNE